MLSWNLRGRLLTAELPLVMGVLNLTEDSFHAGSRFPDPGMAVARAVRMLDEGADILDLGAQSTRPGSHRIDAGVETSRLLPVIRGVLAERPDACLSVDTYHAEVAASAVEAGARVVNDVSGGSMDGAMLATVGGLGVPYVCMHMQGRPEDMQLSPRYDDVVGEVFDYFADRIDRCRAAGITDLALDPGFGFGKTLAHNYALLDGLSLFRSFGFPVMAGLSRKSMIQKVLAVEASEALNGTTVLNTVALMKGADILRVHDVREACEVVRLVAMLPRPE